MATARTVLPPASTPLETVIDTTFPRAWGTLAELVEPASTAHNAQLLPWIAQQWQVTQFAPYFDTVDALMAEAVPWLMERGSAASVRRALRWLRYHSVTIDEDGAWLHIDAGQNLTAAELARVAHVVRESLPAHVNFWRVFHGYDVRPIVLDKGPALDAGMLDGYSGVPGGSGLEVSFGERGGGTLPLAPVLPGVGAATHRRISVARYDDMPVLDAWRLDSHVLAGVSGGVMELFSSTCNAANPGGGTLLQREIPSAAVPWIAPPPVGARTDAAASLQPSTLHPSPHWGGPWAGPWQPVFWLISSEET
ncbi:phage tail protein [Paracidovorax valerianellae]|uniref:phage tail protein n=1 Tax=Paracidovorax valerianellae TaxID=187868 RepID=UPI002303B7D9|nr:phage tail protein [Paracidovorax valerianellae]MDA8444763.1 phage tail protein [Paracidovorax valerianellae]